MTAPGPATENTTLTKHIIMQMHVVESRITISDEIFRNEWMFYYGDRRNEKVVFVYHNIKTGKDNELTHLTYQGALELARYRRSDGRYKNYEFVIY